MPAPNLYVQDPSSAFAAVAPALQVPDASVLYATDRSVERLIEGRPEYGYRRSRSLSYGLAEVQFGNRLSWDELVRASTSRDRKEPVSLDVSTITEAGRLPPVPAELEVKDGVPVETASYRAQAREADTSFRQLISKTAAVGNYDDVLLYVHGYDSDFNDAVQSVAELWHMTGRTLLPVAYSWPAGIGGLKGYAYDRESSEYTVYHFKQLLRLLGSQPGIRRVNIVAHSRGTDVITAALRELSIETRAQGLDPHSSLKLGTVVLAAPDLDMDVVSQRFTAELGWSLPDRLVIYVNRNDSELGLAAWLFQGLRVGELEASSLSEDQIARLSHASKIQIISVEVPLKSEDSHEYFRADPAVSSDLILVLRTPSAPGARKELVQGKGGFWEIHEGYPRAVNLLLDGERK